MQKPLIAYFVAGFAQLAREGVGPHRGRAVLEKVTSVAPQAGKLVFDGLTRQYDQPIEPLGLGLTPEAAPVGCLRIEFQTPTEIKGGEHVVARPEFGTLFARARDQGRDSILVPSEPLSITDHCYYDRTLPPAYVAFEMKDLLPSTQHEFAISDWHCQRWPDEGRL